MDILINADKSTSVYRKHTHTNLYVRYNSCAPYPPKTVSSNPLQDELTSYAPQMQHLQKELDTVYTTSLQNGHPPDRVKRIMDSVKQKLENPNKLTLKQFKRQLKATTTSLTASFPFHPTITKKIKKSLASLRDLLTETKNTPPPHLTPNVIYEISCNDCTATYNGQTNRLLIKRIKGHESHSRLHLHNPDDFSHNQSAPAHHSRTTGRKIAWDRTTILTTTRYKTQLDLTEHTAMKTRNPSLNRTDSAPTCSKLWDPIIPKIACIIKPRPEEDWHMPIESFQYFIILFRVNQVFTFYHFIMLHVHVIHQLITLSDCNLRIINKTQGKLLGGLPISLLHFKLHSLKLSSYFDSIDSTQTP